MTTGMEGAAAGAAAMGQQAQGLRAAVDNGQLVMDPAAAERVARVYEEKAEAVQDLVRDASRLIVNGAYGDCFIGRQLEQKFNEKVNGPGGAGGAAPAGTPAAGVIPILRETERILKDMAQAYRDSARDMQNADEANAENLGRNA